MRLKIFTPILAFLILVTGNLEAQHSIAREWNEVTLTGIRNDFARPTVHARNLWHISMAMYDAWAVFDDEAETYLLGKTVDGFTCDFDGFTVPTDPVELQEAKEEAISFAVYRIILNRFLLSPGNGVTIPAALNQMINNGYNQSNTSTDYSTGSAAALGNYIAECIIAFGMQDGSNQAGDYENLYYEPVNPPLVMEDPGNPNILDYNRWQPLTLDSFVDQSGNPIGPSTPDFLSPEWGLVTPFSLGAEDLTIHERDGNEYYVYFDPGDPCYLDTMNIGGLSEEYKWNHSLVSVWSSHLDPADGVMIDISPGAIGNISVDQYPTDIPGLQDFYDYLEGGDVGLGWPLNPVTGMPYEPQIVPRADYGRVLAEFWADGPDSETPPGHWFAILNEVMDHPLFEKRFAGITEILPNLEWDVKAYFMMGGTMHDVAITAWGIKGWYDYLRPVSSIRGMAERGQSSDPNLPRYDEGGIPLVPGYIELVEMGDPLAGAMNENVDKIKVYAWKGPDYIDDPETDVAGVDWILADNWFPYQRPSFVTPPFAGYVSGHSTYSRAAAEVMTMLTGSEYFPGGMGVFECPQNEFLVFEDGPSIDIELQWATYRDASDQCSLSRIWGGIHPPVDDIPGRLIGLEIGPQAFNLAESYFYNDLDFDGYFSYEDCDDGDADIYPGAPELCDGKDNDCNGMIDDGIPYFTYYSDGDEDGFGDAADFMETCALVAPEGYVDNDLDCDDNNDTINPDAMEVCDEIDNNCNGMIDDGIAVFTYYFDADADGFGDAAIQFDTCGLIPPAGYVDNDLDCDDDNDLINPDAIEICDEIDNNCNGMVDDGLTVYTYYQDMDGDNFGNMDVAVDTCGETAPIGFVDNNEDCDDTNDTVYPGAPELADGIDNDCNGIVDGTSEYLAEGWEIFPNPVSDVLIVEQKFFVQGSFQIMSADGRVLETGAVSFGNGQAEISFKEMPKGVYLIVFMDDDGIRRYIGKVIRL